MSKIFLKLVLLTIFTSALFGAGKVTGASMHETPNWFKQSFLDMSEDVEEAKDANKHVMLFLDLDGCPYCTRMMKESFLSENETQSYIKKHFDVININVKGSREIAWSEDKSYTEKELAKMLKVPYSPTVLFLDGEKNIVVRLNGYRNPAKFLQILEYVNTKEYENMKLTEYLTKVQNKTLYTLKENKHFKDMTDFSSIKSPLALIFEDGSCFDCKRYHDITFKNKEVDAALGDFTVVRLDATSDKKIKTPEGKSIAINEWVKELNLEYRPGMLLYNEGKLQNTVDALLYSFHFKELLRYVSNKEYKNFDNYLEYLSYIQGVLLNEGKNIDLSN